MLQYTNRNTVFIYCVLNNVSIDTVQFVIWIDLLKWLGIGSWSQGRNLTWCTVDNRVIELAKTNNNLCTLCYAQKQAGFLTDNIYCNNCDSIIVSLPPFSDTVSADSRDS